MYFQAKEETGNWQKTSDSLAIILDRNTLTKLRVHGFNKIIRWKTKIKCNKISKVQQFWWRMAEINRWFNEKVSL